MEDDGIRGDDDGDFDADVVAAERARLKRAKVGLAHHSMMTDELSLAFAEQSGLRIAG